jgi:UDP-arabinose 4-epimerase
MTSKAVLVTGGAGYIGSHACKALARAGFVPVAYDNLSSGHAWAAKWGPLVIADILDSEGLAQAFRRFKPVAVIHFAASAYVGESVRDPGKYYRNNVAGTLNLLEAMIDHGIKRVIFSSTCATYGVPTEMPIRESHAQSPINPYGASKLMGERMLADFGSAHGLRSIALRYFNAAGADADGEIREDHTPETHLVPLVLDAAAGLRPHVTILGNDYDTPDGTCIRDYVHVRDLAHAHVLALEALLCGSPSTAYNLGNGRGFSVGEVIAAARRVTRRRIDERVEVRRPGDPPRLVGDATRALIELGWAPYFEGIEGIIKTAWAWHRKKHAVADRPVEGQRVRVANA